MKPQRIIPGDSLYLSFDSLVAPTGIEPVLSALKGPRVNQLHHGAKNTLLQKVRIGSVNGDRTRTLRLERAAC